MSELNTTVDISDLIKKSAKLKLLDIKQERVLISQYQIGNEREKKEALTKMILHNIRLVIKIAKKTNGKDLNVEELVQEGVFGIKKALNKFDLSTTFKFSTYATWWIRQTINRAIEKQGSLIRIPNHIQAEINFLRSKYKEYKDCNPDLGDPSLEELSKITGMPIRKIKKYGLYLNPIGSIDEGFNDEENLTTINYLSSDGLFNDEASVYLKQPDQIIEKTSDRSYVENVLDNLNSDDRKFIQLRFGFIDNVDRTYKEMATIFNSSIEQIKKREIDLLNEIKSLIDLSKMNTEFIEDEDK